ncbi:hypothetical protein [Saccharopolyspora sp. ASAGF58]|uniref:hypothetical protein n=1 Tax=Saccharopolyspora sp. ASAGF58 TaxID=2719023 RepID=UPI00143FC165|nr:hypothetical protein [Saccharopolyspora sp. ASAGF58]QIZ34851.1 hypothetical protein FDZ84_09085 [Saccharopolyspora sp. ASAGF58]
MTAFFCFVELRNCVCRTNLLGTADIGAITGALVGARPGVAGLPREWVEALDAGDLVQDVADELFWNLGHRNPLADAKQSGLSATPIGDPVS